jgi:hypothetical protein
MLSRPAPDSWLYIGSPDAEGFVDPDYSAGRLVELRVLMCDDRS